ncbi:BLUF domain-containing protein [Clavibacter phaseoli]|uniref:BLUF domain-containing protein n=1 Tax=Clavibacter phaseoli TaxID=1734031 RepID=UPI000E65FB9E|nr:BLUF domain-containing protein [Clavibacter phaseoli]RIJ56885.1 BLUF domain-containing protein [Clavibacter phaseoli]UKF31456.1 BLUF domain-containing protein [Clavibacter phaseoli]UKF37377.1 BLUF domain-containing protein [Clavibacter phaseoli]
MLSIVYSSTAERSFDDVDLAQLLAQSRATNEAHGLTGLLVHREGRFLQLIEGEEDDVRERMAAILADDRHGRIATLMEERITERQFPDWTMGFARYDARVAERIPGYRESFEDLEGDRPDDRIRPALLELIRWFQEDTGRLS